MGRPLHKKGDEKEAKKKNEIIAPSICFELLTIWKWEIDELGIEFYKRRRRIKATTISRETKVAPTEKI